MRLLLLTVTTLGACAQVEPSKQSAKTEISESSQIAEPAVLATYTLAKALSEGPQPSFHAARMSGNLAVSDGCVGLRSDKTFMTLAFAPNDALWDQQRRVLVVRGINYALGNSIEVGGSTSGGPAVKGLSIDVPDRCRNAQIWYVAPGSIALLE